MRAVASVVLAAALLALGTSSKAGLSRGSGPFMLVTLPALGTVTWRCGAGKAHALGYRASPRSATTDVTLRTGGRKVSSFTVQPRDRVLLPFIDGDVQRLTFVQGTGGGTLKAAVIVDFGAPSVASFCWDYSPPRMTVTVFPRQ
jgi:hypothetical protein